jgi:hypothetical protein
VNLNFKIIVFAVVFTVLQPAIAADYIHGLGDARRVDLVTLDPTSTRDLHALWHTRGTGSALLAPAIRHTPGYVKEEATFSTEKTILPSLYSTSDDKRAAVTFSTPKRSRPAEVRVTLRFSVF